LQKYSFYLFQGKEGEYRVDNSTLGSHSNTFCSNA